MKSLGIYFGTFAPCHVGHFEQIVRAKRENDRAFVIVSGYDGDRGDLAGMSLKNRVKAMRELLKDDPTVSVLMLDETAIPKYPAGWAPWLNMLRESVEQSTDITERVTFYVGEDEYMKPLDDYFSDCWEADVVITRVDRRVTGISGTSIRENPLFNWDYVTRPFRRFFVKNVLIIGGAGTGKTALTRDLARRYSTSYSLEYMPDFLTERLVREEELDIKDFHEIGIGQYEHNRRHIHSPGTRKVFFADTDVMMTKLFAKSHLSEQDFNHVAPVFDFYISLQTWALIIVLPTAESGDEMYELMLAELDSQQLRDRTVILEGMDYYEMYEEAHRLVDELLADGRDN
ncbi:AAA family ATPase [Macrococcus equipercicus]|uniref:AAA family ATPase n=1 Tax=Macrococcus equipercicus TaxID=69967 RepID=A0A9Q9F2V7_9STAP|nr:AAA family ATPase [Macrococcus equipercicus]KAA1038383.1 AAA family ATPase [Macrococcus equipercicus]UTH13229.1 AAA family ATPase [Macrococcus equipercicus]